MLSGLEMELRLRDVDVFLNLPFHTIQYMLDYGQSANLRSGQHGKSDFTVALWSPSIQFSVIR